MTNPTPPDDTPLTESRSIEDVLSPDDKAQLDQAASVAASRDQPDTSTQTSC